MPEVLLASPVLLTICLVTSRLIYLRFLWRIYKQGGVNDAVAIARALRRSEPPRREVESDEPPDAQTS